MGKKRDFLSLWDVTEAEFAALIRRAEELRFLRQVRTPHATRPGRVVGLIFEKASTRTRVSFEVAVWELGGHAIVLGRNDSQLGRGEPIKDTARVMSRYCHAIMVRTFGHERATELAEYATVPVINGLTDLLHPCQIYTDAFTAAEHWAGPKGDLMAALRGRKIAFLGDTRFNMANSWILGAAFFGLEIVLAGPKGYEPGPQIKALLKADGLPSRFRFTTDPFEAVAGADIVYTDVWTSMGLEGEAKRRIREMRPYAVTGTLFAAAKPDALFMHCLPAHPGEEVAQAVLDNPRSIIFDQAENRLHVQKAILAKLAAKRRG